MWASPNGRTDLSRIGSVSWNRPLTKTRLSSLAWSAKSQISSILGAAKIARLVPVDIFGFRHALEGVERINFSSRVELLQAPSHEDCATAAIRSALDDVL